MSSEKLFCPEFVYEICVGLTVYDFVFKDLSLSMVAKQYSMGLSEHYKPVHEDEMSVPADNTLIPYRSTADGKYNICVRSSPCICTHQHDMVTVFAL